MRNRDEFVQRRQARWQTLERLLANPAPLYRRDPKEVSQVAALYRILCSDLMRARSLGLGHDVTFHLNALTSRAHNALYGPEQFNWNAVTSFLVKGFPGTVRKNWRPLLVAHLLFYGPLLFGALAALSDPRFALSVLPTNSLEQLAESYSQGFEAGRDGGADSAMTGFYIYNNIGIAFRCFATGILFGAGSLFFIIYNGLTIGTVFGHVSASGYGTNILTFACGHGPFELTAIVISGAAGLKMGYALVSTQGRTRLGSLRAQSTELAHLVIGAAVMLFIAALIEGFWSPSSVPPPVKWAFSACACALLAFYFLFAGRAARRSDAP